jgi:UDP-GlcNAc:undecaprenyl-phosphate GlcNAc-1-phosphate transferase
MQHADENGMMLTLSGMLAALLISAGLILVLRPLAERLGLLDIPRGHKTHGHPTPMVGGLAMYFAVMICVLAGTQWLPIGSYQTLFLVSAVLVLFSAYDDYRHVSVYLRLGMHIAVATTICLLTNTQINDLGRLFGGEVVNLGVLALPFTVFAMVGAMNAMNMIDGIDGLAGGVALISFAGLAMIAYLAGDSVALTMLLVLMSTVLGFLMFNFPTTMRRHASVFMGDAGSMFLGMVICYFLIRFSQGDTRYMTPMTAVWLFGLPLLDSFGVMLWRAMNRRSPFTAGNDHMHHELVNSGLYRHSTVWLLLLIHAICISIGLIALRKGVTEVNMLVGAIAAFLVISVLIHLNFRKNRGKNSISSLTGRS